MNPVEVRMRFKRLEGKCDCHGLARLFRHEEGMESMTIRHKALELTLLRQRQPTTDLLRQRNQLWTMLQRMNNLHTCLLAELIDEGRIKILVHQQDDRGTLVARPGGWKDLNPANATDTAIVTLNCAACHRLLRVDDWLMSEPAQSIPLN